MNNDLERIEMLKKKEQEEEQEYIISYAKDYYRVDQAYWFPERKADYLYAVSHHHLKEGDMVPWNNQYWWSVKAKNAKSAFEKFWEKFCERETVCEKSFCKQACSECNMTIEQCRKLQNLNVEIWECPACGYFLMFEPAFEKIPRRCQNCGQLMKRMTREEAGL